MRNLLSILLVLSGCAVKDQPFEIQKLRLPKPVIEQNDETDSYDNGNDYIPDSYNDKPVFVPPKVNPLSQITDWDNQLVKDQHEMDEVRKDEVECMMLIDSIKAPYVVLIGTRRHKCAYELPKLGIVLSFDEFESRFNRPTPQPSPSEE